MKSWVLFAALLMFVALGTTATVASKAPTAAKKQKAVMTFSQPIMLQGVMLKGEYLFVHDDAAMARGEACTYVYKGDAEIPGKLVVSFHCTPSDRLKVSSFTVRTELISGVSELREFQYAGETEAHVVPAK